MVESMRMDITKLAPDAYKHLAALEQTVAGKLDRQLYHLIKLRASQINGCAFCIGMHSDEALRDGEKVERLLLLDAWQESSVFSEKERAALEWVEEITRISAETGGARHHRTEQDRQKVKEKSAQSVGVGPRTAIEFQGRSGMNVIPRPRYGLRSSRAGRPWEPCGTG